MVKEQCHCCQRSEADQVEGRWKQKFREKLVQEESFQAEWQEEAGCYQCRSGIVLQVG